MGRSILVVDGESTFAPAVVRCLGAVAGIRVHVLSKRTLTPLRFSRAVRSVHTWPRETTDPVAHINRLAESIGADLVVAVDEPAIRLLAGAADRLTTPHAPLPPTRSFDVTIDKWAFAEFAAAHSIPHPPTSLCRAGSELPGNGEIPMLLKPRRGSNGYGIRHFDDGEALRAFLRAHPELDDRDIVQTVIDGYDIDCSVLCERGAILAATVQRGFATGGRSFSPAGHLEFVHDPDVVVVVRGLMAALEWTGVAHVDLRRDARTGELAVLEVNPRFWGSVLGSLHAGVNFPWIACQAGLHEPFTPPRSRRCRYVSGAAAVRAWLHGRLRASHAGFDFCDTAFRYALKDPGPLVAELFL